jgi:hypothetical protein
VVFGVARGKACDGKAERNQVVTPPAAPVDLASRPADLTQLADAAN